MANLLFYKKTVALNKDIHRYLKIAPVRNDYRFTANTNSVIVTAPEFSAACKDLPIVFSVTNNNQIVPVVLLGIRNNENLLLTEENKWRGRYVPGYIRRYPFVLADGFGENDAGTLTVCIDESYHGFGAEDGEALFEKDGAYSLYLTEHIKLLQDYHAQFKLTEAFVKKLQGLNFFTEYKAIFDLKDGKRFTLGEFLVVNEKKLRGIGDDIVLDLFHSGQLAWIYFHLASLANLGNLVDIASEKIQEGVWGG